MNADAVVKRYWVVVTGGMIALAAYLQASGVGQIFAAHLAPSTAAPPPKLDAQAAPKNGDKSASPILARNAFDSVTGPLEGVPLPPGPSDKPAAVRTGGDPYKDPPCPGVKSSLVTAAEDPEWSFAALSSSDGKSQLRRRGDKIGSATVHHIGWLESVEPDYVARVWMIDGSARCLVEMGGAEKGKPAPKAPADGPTSKSPKAKLAAEIEQKIKKVGENQYIVERSGVEQIIQNYARLAGSLRTRPTKEGMRLSGIKPNDILSKLGMKNGDLLQSINGFDMSDPDKAVDAYAKLRSAGKLAITVNRDGSPFTVDISIQ